MFKERISALFVAIIASCWSITCLANFDKAMALYNDGDYVEAKLAFEALAAIGNRSSLFNLGVMTYKGQAAEQDPVRAYVLMSIANDGLNDDSFSRIISALAGSLKKTDVEKANALKVELEPVYAFKHLKNEIFPRPLNDEDCPPKVQPLKRTAPKYPRSQAQMGKMGITQTEYTISPEGYPRDIVVTGSTNQVFTDTSVNALKGFQYEAPLDGSPVHGHRNIFTYKLGDADNGTKVNVRSIRRQLKKMELEANKGDVVAQYKYAYSLNTFRYFKSYLKRIDLQYKAANEWYSKSAQGGLVHAQFEMGRNMIQGRGCEADAANGFKWVTAAAVGGYSPAQRMLALSVMSESNLELKKSAAAMNWLRNAVLSNDYSARVLLAWELSTSVYTQLRNGKEAIDLLEVKPTNYYDELRITETKAAAWAERGEYEKAIKVQGQAIVLAQQLDWNIKLLDQRMALYEKGMPFRGAYY